LNFQEISLAGCFNQKIPFWKQVSSVKNLSAFFDASLQSFMLYPDNQCVGTTRKKWVSWTGRAPPGNGVWIKVAASTLFHCALLPKHHPVARNLTFLTYYNLWSLCCRVASQRPLRLKYGVGQVHSQNKPSSHYFVL